MSGLFDLINDNLLNGGAYKDILKACGTTFGMTLLAWIIAAVFGGLISLLMCYEKKAVSRIAEGVCFVFRSIPALVLVLLFYYGVFGGTNVNGVLIVGTALGLYGGGHLAELIARFVLEERKNFSKEADKRLERNFFTLMLPEALEKNLFHIKRLTIHIMQWTAVAGYVSVNDLTEVVTGIGHRNMYPFFGIFFAAICYLAATALIELVFNRIAKKIKGNEDK